MSLVPVDTTSALAVSDYLTRARDWLATAVEKTGPQEIAAARAEIATAAEATKQLGLSKEIQQDALEMVRRAEYALGKAIRKGQAEGTIAVPSENSGPFSDYRRADGSTVHVDRVRKPNPISPTDAAGVTVQRALTPIYELTDGVEPEQFEAALDAAKTDGNLSRNNVVRKLRASAAKEPHTLSRQQRADLIEELAAQGYSSRQMPNQVGVSEETVRLIARDFDLTIPADRSIGRTRRVNSTQIVVNTATALEGLVMGIELIDFDALDVGEVRQWTDSLTESIRALNRFNRQIKESLHD